MLSSRRPLLSKILRRGGFSLASRPRSKASALPHAAPNALRPGTASMAPSRLTASMSAASLVKRLTSWKGGLWLKTSWVANGVMGTSRPDCARASLSTAPGARERSRRAGLAGGSESAYRGRFNDQSRSQSLLRTPAFADVRELIGGRDQCLARLGRQGRREQPSDQQKTRCLTRPHPDQPVLRGLYADAELVRARRQAARR